MFGDWKAHSWDLESTHMRHADRRARLILTLALLYVWLVLSGKGLIKAGCRAWVDHPTVAALAYCVSALDTLQRCFTLADKLPVPPLSSSAILLSGS